MKLTPIYIGLFMVAFGIGARTDDGLFTLIMVGGACILCGIIHCVSSLKLGP